MVDPVEGMKLREMRPTRYLLYICKTCWVFTLEDILTDRSEYLIDGPGQGPGSGIIGEKPSNCKNWYFKEKGA